jgi:hypothetical protein
LLAFDSKDFERRKLFQEIDPDTHEPYLTEITGFYTPLAAGVKFKDLEIVKKGCLRWTEELATEFQLSQKRLLYDSFSLREELSHRRAIPFCDQLVSKLKRYIDSVFFSYVIMPPDKYPTVKVGGFKSPSYDVKSAKFLRNLGPMYPHIAAWSYFGIEREGIEEIQLDGFNSRQTHAWNDLIHKAKLKIFPHGDECNPYIMIADVIAYLTDAKLYSQKLGLTIDNLKEIWKAYDFEVDAHVLSYNNTPLYGWHSEDPIDTTPFLVHPIIFLLVDELEKLQPNPPPTTEEVIDAEKEETIEISDTEVKTEEKRFAKLIRHMEPWYAVTAYACYKDGGAQLFNYHIDRQKVQDGDTMVYIGNQSKTMAESFSHTFDIEVLSAKEIRKAVNREKANH